MIRNNNWYNTNEQRSYPIDDAATGVDDAGRFLPAGILADARILVPRTLATSLMLSAVTTGPDLATVAFAAATGDFVPVAAVSVRRPIVPGRHYPVVGFATGVGGWVVFGDGVEEPYTGRFSSPTQAQLALRCARAYRPLPIESLAKRLAATALRGTVEFRPGADIRIERVTRAVGDWEVEAIEIGLANDLNRNVFDRYAGPCKGRPETRNCDRAAVEQIAYVDPDCDGNLTILFRNVAVHPFVGGSGGVVIDLPLGLADACTIPPLPVDGVLPNEFVDQCAPIVPDWPYWPPGESSGGSSPSSESSSSSGASVGCVRVPYCTGFSGGLAEGWEVVAGEFAFDPDDSPLDPCVDELGLPPGCYVATNSGSRNASVWAAWNNCEDDVSTGKTAATHVKLLDGPKANGGVVLNYGAVAIDGAATYFLALANHRTNAFEIWNYNGTRIALLTGVTLPTATPILLDTWYAIEFKATESVTTPGRVDLVATLEGVDDGGAFPTVTLPLSTNDYGPIAGKPGLGTIQAQSRFSHFEYRSS